MTDTAASVLTESIHALLACAVSGTTLMSPIALSWFDRWLRDDEEAELPPKVRYFVVGENRWQTAETWPPEHTPTRWYLRSGGGANTRSGDGVLALERPAEEPHDSYVYDPRRQVPTIGGRGTPNVHDLQPSTHRLFHDADHASCVVLPVVTRRENT